MQTIVHCSFRSLDQISDFRHKTNDNNLYDFIAAWNVPSYNSLTSCWHANNFRFTIYWQWRRDVRKVFMWHCDNVVRCDWVNGVIMRAGPYSVGVIIVTMQTWIIMPQCRPLGDQETGPGHIHHPLIIKTISSEWEENLEQQPRRSQGGRQARHERDYSGFCGWWR